MAEVCLSSSMMDVSKMVITPKGTPFTNNTTQLNVISYNILAPLYVRPIDSRTGEVQPFAAFPWAEPANEVLDWNVRAPKIMQELVASQADVICLQEVQFENDESGSFVLPSIFKELNGYGYRIGAQSSLREIADRNARVLNQEAAIGNVVFWREDRLEAKDIDASIKDANTRVSVCFQGRAGTELAHLGPTVVVSVHLDATSEEQRVKQLSKALEQGRQLGTRNVIIAGDMNTECLPGSCVASMLKSDVEATEAQVMQECISAYRLTSGEQNTAGEVVPSPNILKEWSELREKATKIPLKYRIDLSRVSTGQTRAAYEHGKTVGPCVSWKLDHVLYNQNYLSCNQRWSTLEDDPESTAAGLPNRQCPSDHLPVAVSFCIHKQQALSDSQVSDLISEWHQMQRLFRLTKDEVSAKFDAEIAQLQEKHQLSLDKGDEAGECSDGGSKKKKNKKGGHKPPEEIMNHMRRKRETLKALVESQEKERVERVSRLSDTEMDLAEDRCLFGLQLPCK